MEYLLLALALFAFITALIKLSFAPTWQIALYSIALAGFLLLMSGHATQQSKPKLLELLHSPTHLRDIAVLVTIECTLLLTWLVASTFGQPKRRGRKVGLLLLHYYLPLLPFPLSYYLLVQLIFALPGVPFSTTTYYLAGAMCIMTFFLSYGLKRLLRVAQERKEMLMLSTLFTCAVGLFAASGAERVYIPNQSNTPPLPQILTGVGLLLLLLSIGYLTSKIYKFKKPL